VASYRKISSKIFEDSTFLNQKSDSPIVSTTIMETIGLNFKSTKISQLAVNFVHQSHINHQFPQVLEAIGVTH